MKTTKNKKIILKRRFNGGFGAVFIFVIGIIVVMSIFLMTQFMTGKSATTEIEASDLANRAQIVAESAAEECSYFALTSSNSSESDDTTARELFEKLRCFDKNTDTVPAEPGPSGKGLKYLWTVKHCIPGNRSFYNSTDNTDNIEPGDFVIGPLKQTLFPSSAKLSNESYGILGIEGTVTVHSKSGGVSIERQVQFARDFRVLLLHPPYPFNNYTLFVRKSTPSTPDLFHSWFSAYESADPQISRDFPIEDMASDTRPIVTTAAEIRPEAFKIRAFNQGNSTSMAEQLTTISQDFSAVENAGFKKLEPEKESEYLGENFYNQLDYKSLRNRSSHYYPDFGRFTYNHQKDGVITLNGIYYIEKGVALNHAYSGAGIIVTSSTEDLVIRSLKKNDETDRLTVININSNFDIQPSPSEPRNIVQADIMAVNGTITDPQTALIEGMVYLSHLSPQASAGLHIRLPDNTATKPWEDGDEIDEEYLRKLKVVLSPGYAWKRFWNQRK